MTHHAYYIEGDLSQFEAYKEEIPHFLAQKYERFGIDESRELQQQASLKVLGEEALFFIGTSAITSEAQQALLKLFEEPQPGVVFVFLVAHGSLLPTLRSRMLEYPNQIALKKQSTEAAKFLKASSKARSAEITALLKDEENVKERVRELLAGLELELAKHMQNPKARTGLEDIAKVRSYVGDRSPALKMLLEHLAVALPMV
jgi:hypothetical protein